MQTCHCRIWEQGWFTHPFTNTQSFILSVSQSFIHSNMTSIHNIQSWFYWTNNDFIYWTLRMGSCPCPLSLSYQIFFYLVSRCVISQLMYPVMSNNCLIGIWQYQFKLKTRLSRSDCCRKSTCGRMWFDASFHINSRICKNTELPQATWRWICERVYHTAKAIKS